jgi:acyl-CoA thioesterase FadM
MPPLPEPSLQPGPPAPDADAWHGFEAEYRVRFDEAGPDGLIRTSTLLRYAQDVAWRHSEARGFDREWYAGRGLSWVVRGVELTLRRAIPMGATLRVSTAVIGHRRIFARRLAEARLPDGAVGARITTDWVILDTRGRPIRIPSDFGLQFSSPALEGDLLRTEFPAEPGHVADGPVLRLAVRPRDLDPVGHVNNAVYLDWLEEALVARGHGRGLLDAVPRTARIEYLAAAGPGDEVEVRTTRDDRSWSARIDRADGVALLRASGLRE